MSKLIYRFAASVITGLLLLAAPSSAQVLRQPRQMPPPAPPPEKKKEIGPRAIAVVQWSADPSGKATTRLLPVALLDDDQFYDASLYEASPVPMSLDYGNVYQVLAQGEPIGFYTIENSGQVHGRWFGVGKWQEDPHTEHMDLSRRQSAREVKPGEADAPYSSDPKDDRSAHPSRTVYDENGKPETAEQADADTRPTLKRKDDTTGAHPAPVTKSSTPMTPDSDPDRPHLKRGSGASGTDASTQPASTPASSTNSHAGSPSAPRQTANSSSSRTPTQETTSTADSDPDRPRLKRGRSAETSDTATLADTAASAARDPERPTLRHSPKGTDTSDHGTGSSIASTMGNSAAAPLPMLVSDMVPAREQGAGMKLYEAVAVSDASDNDDSAASFRYAVDADQIEKVRAKVAGTAEGEIRKFLASIGKSVPTPARQVRRRGPGGKPAGAMPPALRLRGIDLRAYDLAGKNDPVYVLSASESENGVETFVTVVDRLDLDGIPEVMFSSVTDSRHLDAYPKLEMIDAVAAGRDHRGDLLFRRITADGKDFVIYKLSGGGLKEIFHGGNAS